MKSGLSPFSGGFGEGETPLPIPNREVKPLSADGTWLARAWESRTPPVYFRDKGPPAGGPESLSALSSGAAELDVPRLVQCPMWVVSDLPRVATWIDEDTRIAAPEGFTGFAADRGPGLACLLDDVVYLAW